MKDNLQSTQKGTPYALVKSIQNKLADSPCAYLAYCFILPVLVMYLIYMAMEIHPFGDGTVLVLDLNGQYVYFFEALREVVWGDGSLLYSFVRNLGGEFVGIYAYYLASPLSYIVALFPKAAMQEAMLTLILLKVGLCGLSFGWYLHRHTAHPSKPIITTFSLLYALSAYAVIYQSNIMWIDALIWLPILTDSIEQLIKNRRYKLFVISLALTLMSNYYIGYMVCVYTALYFFYYLFSHAPEQTNPHGERLHKIRATARIALFSLLAIAISAFVILGAYYSLSFGKNEFSNPNWDFTQKFEFLDFFTKFLPGTYDTVRPEGLPLVYCGILTLFLIPIYFLSRKIATREKIGSLLLIVFFVLSFICRPLDLVWHGFQAPNWLNYRYSFMLVFLLLVMAYKGLGNLRSIGSKFVFATTAMLLLFVTVCGKQTFESYVVSDEKLMTLETVWLSILAIVAIGVLLCLLVHAVHPKRREALAMILMSVVCIEVFCSSLACVVAFDDDVSYATYSSYDDFLEGLRPIVDKVEEYDGGFYRAEKLKHRKLNDNMALGLRGLSGSTSTLNAETIQFLHYMGYASRSHLSQYLGGNPVNDSLLGIRYVIDENKNAKLARYEENAIAKTELYTAYKNPYALSLAYGVDASVNDFSMTSADYNTHFERLNALVGTMLGDETSAPVFEKVGYFHTTTLNCTSKRAGTTITYTQLEDSKESGTVTFTFTAPQSAEYYFHTPAKSRPKEVKVSVGEQSLGKYLGSNRNSILSLGYFEKGEEIKLTVTLLDDPLKISLGDYFWYLNEEAFTTAFDALLAEPQLVVDDTSTDAHLTGTLKTEKKNQTILTTIPYDEGWTITLNGKPVQIYKTLDSLIAFDVDEAGSYDVELIYMPRIYRTGLIVSGVGIAAFVLICLADFLLKKARKRHTPQAYALLGEPWTLTDFDEDAARQNECSAKKIEPKPIRHLIKERKQALLQWGYRLLGKDLPIQDEADSQNQKKK